ncbi:glycoside hydrolase family 2 protein [Schizophyllum amplum]|uniref:Beta-mannosidase B n=1 Tax=Schizophyllum amplum TaxID=97359 RepID=A0A550CBG0_9AGAR|nr:glycoside hydrolase family 2 protein [Auriculariopsis ampla]
MPAAETIVLSSNWAWKRRGEGAVLDELKLGGAQEATPTNIDDPANHLIDGSVPPTALTSAWYPARNCPSEVHVELRKAGLIPDPYIGSNEHGIQWIGESEWLYKCEFAGDGQKRRGLLEFAGLDAICDVYLNGTRIFSSDNQFRTWVHALAPGELNAQNVLLIHFKSAKALALAEEAKYGRVRAGSTNLGAPSRVYVRKAQYDWRWDWGPELMTCGVYRPVTLKFFHARIADVFTKASLVSTPTRGSKAKAALRLDLTVDGSADRAVVVLREKGGGHQVRREEVDLTKAGGVLTGGAKSLTGDEIVASEAVGPDVAAAAHGTVYKDVISWTNLEVKPWWPTGYGAPDMYEVEVEVLAEDNTALDSTIKRVGFRSVELVQDALKEADEYGTGITFFFRVNGVRMFMGGSNWIPADNFLTTLTPDRYRAWLTLLRDGNQNMVRLWGGGVYEPDCFYDACDDLGLLVWQDFQFACGVYPAHPAFVATVRQEVVDNVTRMRHHPSLAIYCGNNEDYQMVLQWGDVAALPARKLYEEVFPDVVGALTDPAVPYHRGSPYGGKGWDTADPTIGDVHQWNIWGGKELPYQEYDHMGGRFVSEFGLPSLPVMSTIKHWMGDALASEYYSQSPLIAQHNRAGSFERRFAIVMNENFRLTEDLETYAFHTQMMQSDGVGWAYQAWRRKWAGPGKEYTSGALVWQSNDCWPVASWAIIDYFLRPKPIYYTMKRHLAPVSVGIYREVIHNRPTDRPRQYYEFAAIQSHGAKLDVWGCNATLEPIEARLELFCVDLQSDWTATSTHDIILLPNRSTDILVGIPCPAPPKEGKTPPSGDPAWTTSCTVVVQARLVALSGSSLGVEGAVIARGVDWPQPYRILRFPDPELKITTGDMDKDGARELTITAGKPAKGVFLTVDGDDAGLKWSDNSLDVMPGDVQKVTVWGLEEPNTLRVAYMGREKAAEAV